LLHHSTPQVYEYNKLISDFALFQNPHVVRQINQIFFNIVGQHEDFDIIKLLSIIVFDRI
jgi:hypothetical protein